MTTVPLNTGSFFLYRAIFRSITNGASEFNSNVPHLCLAMSLNGDALLPPLAFPVTTKLYEHSLNINVWKEELCAHQDSYLVVSQVRPLPAQITPLLQCEPDNPTDAVPPPVLTTDLVSNLRHTLRFLLCESEPKAILFQQGTIVKITLSDGSVKVGLVVSSDVPNAKLHGSIVVPLVNNGYAWHSIRYIDLQYLQYGHDPPQKYHIPFVDLFALLNLS